MLLLPLASAVSAAPEESVETAEEWAVEDVEGAVVELPAVAARRRTVRASGSP